MEECIISARMKQHAVPTRLMDGGAAIAIHGQILKNDLVVVCWGTQNPADTTEKVVGVVSDPVGLLIWERCD